MFISLFIKFIIQVLKLKIYCLVLIWQGKYKQNYDPRLKDLKRKYNLDFIEQTENKLKAWRKVINSEKRKT